MIVVNIMRNVLEPESVERHETDDLIWLLREQFGEHAPNGARLYHQHVSEYTDVTPTSAEGEERLREMPGPFWLVISPQGEAVWVPLLISAALSAASMVLQMILAPKLPNAAQRNIQAESPNNGLSARVNRERVNGRIPDVYGTVRSTPDLIAVPYFVFEDHVEIEVAYMCVGRGQHEIHDVRDDTTLVSEIDGASAEVYGPYTSPNSGTPQLTIGEPIGRPVLMTKRVGSVNGQVLNATDYGRVSRAPMRFESPNKVVSLDGMLDFTEHFTAGGTLTIQDAEQTEGTYSATFPASPTPVKMVAMAGDEGQVIVPGNVTANWSQGQFVTVSNANVKWGSVGEEQFTDLSGMYDCDGSTYDALNDETTIVLLGVSQVNSNWTRLIDSGPIGTAIGAVTLSRPSGVVQFSLDGDYEIDTISAGEITLVDPATVNAGWDVMDVAYGGVSDVLYPVMYSEGERWIGWFVAESTDPFSRVIANFVNLNGLYADDGEQQFRIDNDILVEAQRVDQASVPYGPVEQFTGVVVGSAVSRTTRALTMDITLPGDAHNRWRFRAMRTNGTLSGSYQIVDETQWRDLYIAHPVSQPHFGDVTTVQYAAKATDKALALKERKLNMLVTRQIPLRDADGFTTTLHSTRNAADILCAIALDPRIGNRTIDEIDVDGIYATIDEVIDYFGFDEAGEFSYTFDKAEMSFEETVGAVASAVFCQAYRRGSQLRLFFERETDDSSLLFNHRNTLPGSESRVFSFGPTEGYDGVQYEYVSPEDDAVVTIYLPDQSAINPQSIESVGVRNHEQANLHAWRAWNKIKYQHTAMERDCLQEADMLVLGERVLCSDTTRSGEQGGYVVDVDGLTLRLSQPMDWNQPGPHVMFIQNSDGQTEGIPVTSGGHEFLAVLSRPPRVPIVTTSAQPTGYIIGSGTDQRQAEPFIVTAKEPLDGLNVRVSAINYDARYYANDGMYRP